MGTKNQRTLKVNMMKAKMAVRNKEMGILPAWNVFIAKINAEKQHLNGRLLEIRLRY